MQATVPFDDENLEPVQIRSLMDNEAFNEGLDTMNRGLDEVFRGKRQCNAVDPENNLVVADFEHDWNKALSESFRYRVRESL